MIELVELTKRYNDHVVLDKLNLKIAKGDFVFIIGKSGAGKSSLLKLLRSQERPSEGVLKVLDYEFTPQPRRDNKQLINYRQKIGIVYQDFRLLSELTLFENLAYPLETSTLSENEIKERVLETLKLLDLLNRQTHYPSELSGGEQQRGAIGRALITEPELILADEPTANLDQKSGYKMMELFEKINQQGTTVVMATHNVKIVDGYQYPVIELVDGKLIRSGDGGGYYHQKKP